MGSLEMAQQEIAGLAPADRLRHLAVLRAGIDALQAAALAELAADAEALLAEGARGVADWLTTQTGAHPGEAAGMARLAAALPSMPATASALRDGALSSLKARLLAEAAGVAGFADDEAMLVAGVAARPWEQARRFVRRWIVAHTDASEVEQRPSTATLTQRPNGRWSLHADLDEVDGLKLNTELDRLIAELRSSGIETDERRAAALLAMCARSVTLGDRRPGARPEIIVVATVTDEGQLADLRTTDGAAVRRDVFSRLCCGATMRALLQDAHGDPLFLGDSARLATPGQHRACEVRDKHCTFPGCGVPASRCEVHHEIPVDDDGPTDLDNLRLRCPAHHALDHRRGFTDYIDKHGHRVRRHHHTGVLQVLEQVETRVAAA